MITHFRIRIRHPLICPCRQSSITIIPLKEDDMTTADIMKKFTAVLCQEDDMYIAEYPEVGTFNQGETIEEAVANLREATELYLAEFPVPPIH